MSISIYTTIPRYSNELAALVKNFFPGVPLNVINSDDKDKVESDLAIKCQHESLNSETRITIKYLSKQREVKEYSRLYKIQVNCPNDGQERWIKNHMKRLLYRALKENTGKDLKWGTLTGIRPVKIVHGFMDKGLSESQVLEKLYEDYRISTEKSHLLLDIARIQRPFFENNSPDKVSIYINIPICTSKCLFCSFPSDTLRQSAHLIDDYIAALDKEMKTMTRVAREKGIEIESIYVGGGTPTAPSISQLERILASIEKHWGEYSRREYTVEGGRPDTMDKDKLGLLKNYGVDRISINPQTMSDKTLKSIGRGHTRDEVIHCFRLARDIGFQSINMDVIAGLPGEGIEDVSHTMESIKQLRPDNLTVHSLTIKRGSNLRDNLEDFSFIEQEKAAKMMDIFYQGAADMKMKPYYLYRQKYMLGNMENIGFALTSKESIYNMQIMDSRQSIWAFGAAAVTRIHQPGGHIQRVPNVKNIEEYINRIHEMIDRKIESVF